MPKYTHAEVLFKIESFDEAEKAIKAAEKTRDAAKAELDALELSEDQIKLYRDVAKAAVNRTASKPSGTHSTGRRNKAANMEGISRDAVLKALSDETKGTANTVKASRIAELLEPDEEKRRPAIDVEAVLRELRENGKGVHGARVAGWTVESPLKA